jgi:hypothetical protein
MDLSQLREHTKAAIDQVLWAAASLQTLRAIRPETVIRLDKTYAAHAFNRICQCLEHDAVLALNRVWDNHRDSLNISRIVQKSKAKKFKIIEFWNDDIQNNDPEFQQGFDDLPTDARESISRLYKARKKEKIAHTPELIDGIFKDLDSHVTSVIDGKYKDSQSLLRRFRNKYLAHREMRIAESPATLPKGGDIDALLEPTSSIVEKLDTLLNRTNFSVADFSNLDRLGAESFWKLVERAPKVLGE